MSITLFGTCRLRKIDHHNDLHNLITYSHSTKEVIQLITFLKGELVIPFPYNQLCFRTAIRKNTCIDYNDTYHKLFVDSDLFIIEICSMKKYVHNTFYVHHLCVDKRFSEHHQHTPADIAQNHTIETQTDEEIEHDILNIQQLLFPKKMLIVSHYNSMLDGEYIPSRNHLIQLLDCICRKHDIPFIDPTRVLSKHRQETVMSSDLGHYTEFGLKEFGDYVNRYIVGTLRMCFTNTPLSVGTDSVSAQSSAEARNIPFFSWRGSKIHPLSIEEVTRNDTRPMGEGCIPCSQCLLQ